MFFVRGVAAVLLRKLKFQTRDEGEEVSRGGRERIDQVEKPDSHRIFRAPTDKR